MSEHHRGAWGTREDPVWWPAATITTTDQQTLHHQHLINQQIAAQQQQIQHQAAVQQQQQAQQQQQQQQQSQQVQQQQQAQQQQIHNEIARSNCTTSNAVSQQLFSYKMASSFQNPATTISGVNVSSANTPYDYRLNMGQMVSRANDNPGMSVPTSGTQWWYTQTQNSIDNSQQQQHQQNVHQGQTNQHQNIHNVHTPSQQMQNAKITRIKADAKPRGRMTAYAFFVQTCREEHKKKHPEETVIFAEFSKKCAERWKTMLDKEKKRFHEMAEKDKKRYDLEMQNYVPPKGVVLGRGKKRKHIKDPNAPKRSLSAFFWFCNDERTKVKQLNPEYGVGDIAKELGRKWSDADPSMKSKYEALAEEDKRRYEREMTEYKKKGKVVVNLPPQPPPPTHIPQEEDDDDEEGDEEENE